MGHSHVLPFLVMKGCRENVVASTLVLRINLGKAEASKIIVSFWLKTRLNFHLIRSCTLCIRGTRSIHDKTETI